MSKLSHGMAIWKYGWALWGGQYFISLVKRRYIHPDVIFRVCDDWFFDGFKNMDLVRIPQDRWREFADVGDRPAYTSAAWSSGTIAKLAHTLCALHWHYRNAYIRLDTIELRRLPAKNIWNSTANHICRSPVAN